MTVAELQEHKLITAEELLRLPADQRFELVKGVLVEMPPRPGFIHGAITQRLSYAITTHVLDNDLGIVLAAETGFRLARKPDTVRAADIAFVSAARLPANPPRGYLDLAPDFVAEVVSPSDDPDAIQAKVRDWLEAGTRLVLVVYPGSRQAIVYRALREVIALTDLDVFTAPDLFPGLTLPLASVFA